MSRAGGRLEGKTPFYAIVPEAILNICKIMAETAKTISIWDGKIIKRAFIDAFIKLDPRRMMKNPVMFVVEVGAVLTTLQLVRGITAPIAGVTHFGFELHTAR